MPKLMLKRECWLSNTTNGRTSSAPGEIMEGLALASTVRAKKRMRKTPFNSALGSADHIIRAYSTYRKALGAPPSTDDPTKISLKSAHAMIPIHRPRVPGRTCLHTPIELAAILSDPMAAERAVEWLHEINDGGDYVNHPKVQRYLAVAKRMALTIADVDEGLKQCFDQTRAEALVSQDWTPFLKPLELAMKRHRMMGTVVENHHKFENLGEADLRDQIAAVEKEIKQLDAVRESGISGSDSAPSRTLN